MKKFAILVLATLVGTFGFSSGAMAQTPQKLPTCLAYPTISGSIPCTGVAPVDSATGNLLSWQDLMSGKLTPATNGSLAWNNVTATTTLGPWIPQLGRDIWATFNVTGGTFTAVVGTTTTLSCANSNPLTAANGLYNLGTFTSAVNEDIGRETRSGAKYCVTITPSVGATVTGSLTQ